MSTPGELKQRVLWLSSDEQHARLPSWLRESFDVAPGDLELFTTPGNSSQQIVVLDFIGSDAPCERLVRRWRGLGFKTICLFSMDQVQTCRGVINANLASSVLFAPVADEHLRVAIATLRGQLPVEPDLTRTVKASVGALADLLALARPTAFSKGQRIAHFATMLAAEVGITDTWTLSSAAILSQLGMVSISQELGDRIYSGDTLTVDEAAAASFVPTIAEEITQGMSQLGPVRELMRLVFGDDANAYSCEREVQLLRLALVIESARKADFVRWDTIERALLLQDYWAPLEAAARKLAEAERAIRIKEIWVGAAKPDMVLAEDVYDGPRLLLARGLCLDPKIVERLRAMAFDRLKNRRIRIVAT